MHYGVETYCLIELYFQFNNFPKSNIHIRFTLCIILKYISLYKGNCCHGYIHSYGLLLTKYIYNMSYKTIAKTHIKIFVSRITRYGYINISFSSIEISIPSNNCILCPGNATGPSYKEMKIITLQQTYIKLL